MDDLKIPDENERVMKECNDVVPSAQVLPTNDVMLQLHQKELASSWHTP